MKVEDLDKLLEAEAPRYAKSGEMTPELMALLFVDDYYVGSPDLEYVSVEGNVASVGRYFADDGNGARVPAHTLLGATLGCERSLGALTLRGFVAGQNLADREQVASAFINGTGGRFYEPGMPRTLSGGITLRWR